MLWHQYEAPAANLSTGIVATNSCNNVIMSRDFYDIESMKSQKQRRKSWYHFHVWWCDIPSRFAIAIVELEQNAEVLLSCIRNNNARIT